MVATRLEARYNPLIGFLPQLGLAAVLLLGGESVIHAHLTLGQFTAFYLYLNMLISADALARRHARPGPARDRVRRAHLPAARPRPAPDSTRRTRRALPPGNGRVQLRGRDAALRGPHDEFGASALRPRTSPARRSAGARCCSDIDLDVAAGRTVALVGADRLGQDEPRGADPAAV